MRRSLLLGLLLLLAAGPVQARGLLIPVDKSLPPLAMVNHHVTITIDDQVAVTHVEQTFRNHTDRPLEATYLFPVPRGAGVKGFTMWVDGKEVEGELLEAARANQIYTDIVRRTQDPGLLEYVGQNLFRLRVFPVPARGDQKVALSFNSLAPREGNVVEYAYPLKTDGKATSTLEDFSIKATIKSQHAIQNVYSPTHALSIKRTNDREVNIAFERDQAPLDKDFQMFYTLDDKDVGLTALTHRPVAAEDGYFMLLLSPRVEMAKEEQVPRDLVLVLDTSGSMQGVKMEQAKKALKRCLDNLSAGDRFALINFSTAVHKYRDSLTEASKDQLDNARKWCDRLRASGGTAIDDALAQALALRSDDPGRSFTVVFFTDGEPTIGETDPEKILKHVLAHNTASTRIFTFGVGDSDGLNATFLDRLADETRAVSTFVRPEEDIEAKTVGLMAKISHPVLTDLKLTAGDKVHLDEIYPPQLPDLFHGGQVTVFGRYSGGGPVALKLTGKTGKEEKEFVYETTFASKTGDDKAFVEDLWARRKVGYLLDQIRANGEKKELVDEVTALAKRYGIATPYTSYLVAPDTAVPVAGGGAGKGAAGGFLPQALAPQAAGEKPSSVTQFAEQLQKDGAKLGTTRAKLEDERADKAPVANMDKADVKALKEAQANRALYSAAHDALKRRDQAAVQTEKLGVELSLQMNNLRNQTQLEPTALKRAANRNCLDVGGVWVDEGFDAKTKVVCVKAQSEAYFRILERHPELKDVYRLGNHLIWVAPSGTALAVDTTEGKEKLSDEEIDQLFVAQK